MYAPIRPVARLKQLGGGPSKLVKQSYTPSLSQYADYYVKLHNFTFEGGCKKTTNSPFSFSVNFELGRKNPPAGGFT